MLLESDLREYVIAGPNIAAAIGTRMYPARLEQSATLPALTYQVIFGEHESSYTGSSGLAQKRVQITAWAKTYKTAKELAELVRLRLVNVAQTAIGSGNTFVNGIEVASENPDLFEEESLLHQSGFDFYIWANEAQS